MKIAIITLGIILLVAVVVVSFLLYRRYRLIMETYKARRYVYVEIHTRKGTVIKGFARRNSIADFYSAVRPLTFRVETFRDREHYTFTSEDIEYIRQLG